VLPFGAALPLKITEMSTMVDTATFNKMTKHKGTFIHARLNGTLPKDVWYKWQHTQGAKRHSVWLDSALKRCVSQMTAEECQWIYLEEKYKSQFRELGQRNKKRIDAIAAQANVELGRTTSVAADQVQTDRLSKFLKALPTIKR